MLSIDLSSDEFLTYVQSKLDVRHTDDQLKFISSLDGPLICFASPGTGKTTTAVSALFYAELFRHIPGNNIYALSFTNKATAELSVRYDKCFNKLELPRKLVNFKTLHKMCTTILYENYRLLNMSKVDVDAPLEMSKAVPLVESLARDNGLTLSMQQVRSVVTACKSLNSSMIFDRDNVVTKKVFKDTKLEFDDFMKIRKELFRFALVTESIPVESVMLYTLTLLQRNPALVETIKNNCKLMIVDEAQDLSLLHLRLISLMTDCPVLIGDMKQQIFAFNGACQEIVQQFYKLFPTAKTLELNQSFRCKNEILEYADKIIAQNGLGNDRVKGLGHGGNVLTMPDLSLTEIAKQFHEDYYVKNTKSFSRDTMFLFRNNASSIPIADALFKEQVPFLLSSYTQASKLPVIRELIEILNMCRNPYNGNYVGALSYLIPEFKTFYNCKDSPFYKLLAKSACSIFEINYVFKDMRTGSQAMSLLSELSESIRKGAFVTDLVNALWPMYYNNYLKHVEWRLDYNPMYYIRMVNDLMRNKTFDQFMSDEAAKYQFYKENTTYNRGIRCLTMHSAKGLEADDVYVLDADTGIIPNLKKLDQLVKGNCNLEAAREIRNERSLCYVAVTRAKDNVYIVSCGEPASMLTGVNDFELFDETYEMQGMVSDDIIAFNEFVGDMLI